MHRVLASKNDDEKARKKFREIFKKIIVTRNKGPCFVLSRVCAMVVQSWRFGYRVCRGNLFRWHASVGLAYLPPGWPGKKRIL